MGYVERRLTKYLTAASFCSGGWRESFGIMMSVAVGFLYTLHEILCSSLEVATSRKLTLLFISSCIVNIIVDVILLNESSTSWIFVISVLYTIRVSSTYLKYPIK